MDNAIGDNKNWFMFSFWSSFFAKGIIREVYMSFILVGYIHINMHCLEDGRWNMSLRKENYPTIPLFMKSFMDVE
jgi:hypothetical protein